MNLSLGEGEPFYRRLSREATTALAPTLFAQVSQSIYPSHHDQHFSYYDELTTELAE